MKNCGFRTLVPAALACSMILGCSSGSSNSTANSNPNIVPDFDRISFEDSTSLTRILPPVAFSGQLIYTKGTAATGIELFKYDPSTQTESLIKDIRPGKKDSDISQLTVALGAVYFAANDGVSGVELWKTDGTSQGTQRVSDILSGSASSDPNSFFENAGLLYFRAFTLDHGYQLFRTDGSEAGTILIRDTQIFNTKSASDFIHPTAFGNKIVFSTYTKSTGARVWITDGSAAGTHQVPMAGESYLGDRVVYQNRLYTLMNISNLQALVSFDANAASVTTISSYVYADTQSSIRTDLTQNKKLAVYKNRLYFAGCDNASSLNCGLWAYDAGTQATEVLKTIRTGSVVNPIASVLTVFNGSLIFIANDGVTGTEIWISDGTPAGTHILKDLVAGAASGMLDSDSNYRTDFVELNSKLFFTDKNLKIWTTDGTSGGTQMLSSSLAQGMLYPTSYAASNGFLYYMDNNARSVLRVNGGSLAVSQVFDGSSNSLSTGPNFLNLGSDLYFTNYNLKDAKIFKINASSTTANSVTSGIGRLNPFDNAFVQSMKSASLTYFVLRSGLEGRQEIWRSDGTREGTIRLTTANSASIPTTCQKILVANSNDRVFFYNKDCDPLDLDYDLSVTDGSVASTRDIDVGLDFWGKNYGIDSFVSNGYLFFYGRTPTTKIEGLLRLDPSNNDIQIVKTGRPRTVGLFQNRILFTMGTSSQSDIWYADANGLNPTLVKSISNAIVRDAKEIGGKLYISADELSGKGQLWISDATNAGTQMIASGLSAPIRSLTALNGKAFFMLETQSLPRQMTAWISDGTSGGTKTLGSLQFGSSLESGQAQSVVIMPRASDLLIIASPAGQPEKTFVARADENAVSVVKAFDRAALDPTFERNTNSGIGFQQTMSLFAYSAFSKSVGRGEKIYFALQDSSEIPSLYESDGTPAGTKLVVDSETSEPVSTVGLVEGYDSGVMICGGNFEKKLSELRLLPL